MSNLVIVKHSAINYARTWWAELETLRRGSCGGSVPANRWKSLRTHSASQILLLPHWAAGLPVLTHRASAARDERVEIHKKGTTSFSMVQPLHARLPKLLHLPRLARETIGCNLSTAIRRPSYPRVVLVVKTIRPKKLRSQWWNMSSYVPVSCCTCSTKRNGKG